MKTFLSYLLSVCNVKKIAPLFLLFIFACLCFFSQASQSVTVDEFHHLPSGIYNLTTFDWRMNDESPPLIKCFPALSILITDPRIDLKSFEKSPNTWAMGYSFMRLNKDRYQSVFQSGRCFIIILGCLLGWFIYLWAKELYGYPGALFALFLYVFNPNILAHSSLITIDIGASCMIFLSIYCFWKYLNNRNRASMMLAGVALGLAQLAKFTALLLYPIFIFIILIILIRNNNHSSGQPTEGKISVAIRYIGEFCIITLVSMIVINAGYLFSSSFLPLSEYNFSSHFLKSAASVLWHRFPVPLPYDYLMGFDTQMSIAAGGIPFYVSYLMGEHSLTGWWYYYVVAFFVKNPEPLFIIILLAGAAWLGNKKERPDQITVLCVWVPAISYVIYFSFCTHIPIGIRYILPVFPLLFLASGYLLNPFMLENKTIKTLLAVLAVVYLLIGLSVFPRYLSYFNIVSGGSQNGSFWLIDSNLDWGQNLPGLKKYMDKNNIREIKLGYFGRVDPALYGIKYSLAEKEPREGIYAISINYLVGRPYYLLTEDAKNLLLVDMNYFENYRKLKPSAIVDHTIYIYDMRNL